MKPEFFHDFASYFFKSRLKEVRWAAQNPIEAQNRVFKSLLGLAAQTEWGRRFDYKSLRSVREYQARVPVQPYETFYPLIERTMRGEENLLWPGVIKWFAKSSGTTNDRSKYIPVSASHLTENHFACGKDMLALYLDSRTDSKLFTGKILSLGGSLQKNPFGADANVGDVSAVIMNNLSAFYQSGRAPSKPVALMAEWEKKLTAILNETQNAHITGLAGVPTWSIILLERLLAMRGVEDRNVLRIWPGFEVFFHGAVNFSPYKNQFLTFFPSEKVAYRDVYNASEGYFAAQSDGITNDMLLFTNRGVLYEFIPADSDFSAETPALSFSEVEVGKNYALVISVAGLWRYLIGDTIKFTSLVPPKIIISGRTKHFLNAFGEELVVENAETAISAACEATNAVVTDYTAAPVYFDGAQRAAHEWLIEFSREPNDFELFCRTLDETLKKINSDYDAKRHKDIALKAPKIHVLPQGTFYAWMKKRNKLGGQHKVPRLFNDRTYIDEILALRREMEKEK